MAYLIPAFVSAALGLAGLYYDNWHLIWAGLLIMSVLIAIAWTLSEVYERATGKPLDGDFDRLFTALILRRPFTKD